MASFLGVSYALEPIFELLDPILQSDNLQILLLSHLLQLILELLRLLHQLRVLLNGFNSPPTLKNHQKTPKIDNRKNPNFYLSTPKKQILVLIPNIVAQHILPEGSTDPI